MRQEALCALKQTQFKKQTASGGRADSFTTKRLFKRGVFAVMLK
jgi:hypothetical protein